MILLVWAALAGGPPPAPPPGDPVRGRALLTATKDSLPGHVGNALRCTSCHLDDGRRPHAMPWVGVLGRYPQVRPREAREVSIEARVNGCIERSLAGRALPPGGRDMRDIVAYFGTLAQPAGAGPEAIGAGTRRLAPLVPDTARGRALYAAECARCHGADGAGTALATAVWGAGAYNIGAGMARLYTAAAFIQANMPFDRPGSLTPQQAHDVAAYINAQPRQDFPRKHRDYPRGDAPPDAAYATDAAPGADRPVAPRPSRLLPPAYR
ncbi:MAG: c-type cytochrome [Gemmatimonadales bacterium]|nr:c-type cytochrome [Gemmatimonadales bacterium]